MYSGAVFPQDIHFSQFYNVPMVINSASTGIFDGDWQATAGYRNQWRSIAQPYRTLAVSSKDKFYCSIAIILVAGFIS
ncbi:MAG: type IX secretion system membrane protein PorP/SprF [Bacteroidetes bacterium]|nr:type IX secretion system membrane protein PorP/SprF [Bacteroidota bacterium]